MSDFSLRRDIKHVHWGATLLHNLLRAVLAGFVWCIIMLLVKDDPNYKVWEKLLTPIIFPLGYLVFLLPLGLLGNALAKAGVPFAGWLGIIFSLMIVVGDPLLYFLDKIRPNMTLVDHPRFVNFSLIVFVMKPDPAALPAS